MAPRAAVSMETGGGRRDTAVVEVVSLLVMHEQTAILHHLGCVSVGVILPSFYDEQEARRKSRSAKLEGKNRLRKRTDPSPYSPKRVDICAFYFYQSHRGTRGKQC